MIFFGYFDLSGHHVWPAGRIFVWDLTNLSQVLSIDWMIFIALWIILLSNNIIYFLSYVDQQFFFIMGD